MDDDGGARERLLPTALPTNNEQEPSLETRLVTLIRIAFGRDDGYAQTVLDQLALPAHDLLFLILVAPDVATAVGALPVSLDAAWAKAEAALPPGWAMLELKNTGYRGDGERWLAMASVADEFRSFSAGYGDTKEAALAELTIHLEAIPR